MSVYSDISKMIGWEGSPVSFPTLEQAERLRVQVNALDKDAFVEVFRYNRYLPSGSSEEQIVIQNVLFKAFSEGSNIWR